MQRCGAYVVEVQGLFVPFLLNALEGADVEVVACTARFIPELAQQPEVRIVFIDDDLTSADAAEATVRAARAAAPSAHVVVYGDDAERYRRAGAHTVVPKRADLTSFLETMREAAAAATAGATIPASSR